MAHARLSVALGVLVALVGLFLATRLAEGEEEGQEVVAPSITPARMDVDTLVPPGATVDLSQLVLRNQGTEAVRATMGVVADDPEVAGWLEFEPAEFEMDPDSVQLIGVRLKVPTDADLGPRLARVRASVEQAVETAGVGVGVTAAVASIVEFEVGWPPEGTAAFMGASSDSGGLNRMLILVPAAIGAGAVAWTLMTMVGRYEFAVRRKPPPDQPPPEE